MKSVDTEELIKTIKERREEAFRWKANADNETDRIKAMVSELTKLGAHVVDEGCRMVVYVNGGKGLHGGEVESYHIFGMKDIAYLLAVS